MPDPDQLLTEDEEDLLDWATVAGLYAVDDIRILAAAIERGDADLQVDPSAWEKTLTAAER
ncbi:hypothetical protein [Sorangium sp. So ce394]|uniref:hypothetical protein n=1 Tax=Sorangium sp. So ce394 TaxID=3133310 RepID=UPI003F5B1D3D